MAERRKENERRKEKKKEKRQYSILILILSNAQCEELSMKEEIQRKRTHQT